MANTPGEVQYGDMTLGRGAVFATDEESKSIIRSLQYRTESVKVDHEIFREWCDRADKLYFPPVLGPAGADMWPEHDSAKINGRQHLSVNDAPAYVDIPASLQAVKPIENVLPKDPSDEGSVKGAAAEERAYEAWKGEEDYDLKWHKAIVTKGLYGRTAGRVYWDPDKERACMEVIQQPRHLYMGWKTDSFEELEWVAYRMFYEPNALTEEYGVEVIEKTDDLGHTLPFVQQASWDDMPSRPWSALGKAIVEVYDYWYRKPVWSKRTGKLLRMDTYNTVIAGNYILRKPTVYKEYKGNLPYIPLFNTFVPGMAGGRPDLYDIEPLLHETNERLTNAAQMIANGAADNAFQLTGPDAPMVAPKGLKPVPGGIISSGPGNRIEVITPFIAQFQLEQNMVRIDRHKSIMTGLNDLLLGLAPAQVLSSSKAINALIANYEARLSIRRKLLYKWRRDIWTLARTVMLEKLKGEAAEGLKAAVETGGGFLAIEDPSLNPRDELETATRALNLMNGKLASQRTAMNWIGIDDPETEQDYIREERTDATMFPADVQVMAQLLQALQAMGLQAPAGAAEQAGATMQQGAGDLRNALGAATPQGDISQQGPGTGGETPPIPGQPVEAGGANLPFASAPTNQPEMQGMVIGGEAKGRIMTKQKLGRS